MTFKESSTAEAVLSLPPHQLILDGRELRVSLAETPKRGMFACLYSICMYGVQIMFKLVGLFVQQEEGAA